MKNISSRKQQTQLETVNKVEHSAVIEHQELVAKRQ